MTDLVDAPDRRPRPSGRSRLAARRGEPSTATATVVPTLETWHGSTVVLSPRAGDELVLAGGLIARQRSLRCQVEVVALSDRNGERVGRRRQLAGLEQLGVARTAVHRLDVVAGTVGDLLEEVVAALADVVGPHDVLVAPIAHDGRPGHRACGEAAGRVAATTGCRLLGLLPENRHGAPTDELALARLELTDEQMERRDRAIACFTDGGARPDPPPDRRRTELYVVGR